MTLKYLYLFLVQLLRVSTASLGEIVDEDVSIMKAPEDVDVNSGNDLNVARYLINLTICCIFCEQFIFCLIFLFKIVY